MSEPLLVVTLADAGDDGRWIGGYVGARTLRVVAVRERQIEDDVRELARGMREAVVTIDQRFMGFLAKRATDTLRELDVTLPALVNPTASIAPDVQLAQGVRIAAGAVIASGCVLGEHARVLERSVLARASSLGAYSTLDPGVVVGDESKIGAHCWLRAGTIVEPRTVIEDACELGPSSVLRGHIGRATLHIPGLDAPARIHRFG